MLRVFLLFIFAVSQFAIAQITITSTDLLGLIGTTQTIEYDTSYAIDVNVGSAGPNQSWVFTVNPTQEQNSFSIMAPEGTPFASDFPGANFVQFYDFGEGDTVYQLYAYADVNPNAFMSIGEGTIILIPEDIDTSYAELNEDETPLPFVYGANWREVSADTTDFGGFLTITADISDYTVDAWGSVTVPAGTFDCLRLRENYTSVTKSVIGNFEIPIDSSSGIIYTWLSKDNFLICDIESQDGETNPEFTQAAYFSRLKSSATALPGDSETPVVTDFSLEQNYPNPFNPVTSISYTIGTAGSVNLSIFDSAGRFVQTLVNNYQNTGKYSVQWDASGLASGIYYYRIQTPQYSEIKKAALLK